MRNIILRPIDIRGYSEYNFLYNSFLKKDNKEKKH